MTRPTTPRRTLGEHIAEALVDSARRTLAGVSDTEEGRAFRDAVARRTLEAYDRLTVELTADRGRGGRIDPRSLRAVVPYVTERGAAIVCAPLVRDLVDDDGRPISAKEAYREMRYQESTFWPDTVPREFVHELGYGHRLGEDEGSGLGEEQGT